MFGPPVAAYIQFGIFKMCLVDFVPLAAKSWRRARFYNCIRCRKEKTRQSISSNLSVRMPIVLPVQRYNIAIWQRWNLETWSRSQESSRGPILRVSDSGYRSRSQAHCFETLNIARIWLCKTVIQRVFSLLYLQVRNNENRSE